MSPVVAGASPPSVNVTVAFGDDASRSRIANPSVGVTTAVGTHTSSGWYRKVRLLA
jgi:hypothetical protein